MKKIIAAMLFCSISFLSLASTLEDEAKSGNAASAYKLAEFYENKNDFKNAMFWYKQAAMLSTKKEFIEKDVIVKQDADTVIKLKQNTVDKKEDVLATEAFPKRGNNTNNHRIKMYEDFESSNQALGFMDSAFGLRPYHSNYILPATYDSKSHNDGRKHFETTFQISFKKDIFENTFGINEAIGFAYTQRNWWQISESSAPFRETNYLPELYVRIPNNDTQSLLKGAQVGLLHESNGQGDDAGKSRSWNRLYLEGYFKYKNVYVVPRAWYRIYESKRHDDNHDIQDFLGYGDLNFFIPYEKHLVKVMVRNNLRFSDNHGAIQADWTYPLGDTGLYGYIQYFYGYGESLIDYNKKTNRIGVGLALSR